MTEKESPVSPDESEIEFHDLDQPGLALPRRPRRSPRQRKVGLALTVTLFLVVSGVLMASTPGVSDLVGRALFKPQPTAVSQNLAFYLRGNPSWGTFVIDGRPLEHLPLIGTEQPLTLPPGSHHITWHARPFAIQTCELMVMDARLARGSCISGVKSSADHLPDISALVISFFASLDDLPPDQRASLAQQAQASLVKYTSSEIVRPGELYAASGELDWAHPASPCQLMGGLPVCFIKASQPLQATLRLQLETNSTYNGPCLSQCFSDNQDCRAFCTDLFQGLNMHTAEGWNIWGVVRLLWTYTTLSGQVIARDQGGTALRREETYQLAPLHLDLDGSGRWRIVPLPNTNLGLGLNDPLCDQAQQDIWELLNALSPDNQNGISGQVVDWQNQMAAGCLSATQFVDLNRGTATPTARAQTTAYCLERFGVVLAANNVAHHLWPELPLADAYEQDLAQRMAATLRPLA